MTVWWRDLSARERMLILIAGALAAVLFVSLGLIRPIASWRSGAEARAQSARDGYELTATAAAIAGGSAQAAPRAQTPMRDALINTARAAGIELVRLGTEADGQLEIQVEPVNGDVFFAWLAELENRYGVTVAVADVTRGQAGVVTPQVLVFERR